MMRRRKDLTVSFGVLVIVLFLAAAAAQEGTEEEAAAAVKVKVGVVLDLNVTVGKMGLSCISMALIDFYSSRSYYKTRVILNPIDSNGTVVGAAAAALDLMKKVEVQAILGPTSSMQANFMIDIGDKAHVPIISFSATRPSLTSHQSPFFFRVAQNDSSQVKAIAAIVKAFTWQQVVPIYSDNEFGDGIIPYLIDALQEVDAHVPYQSIISPTATDDQISTELHKLMTMQTRVFVVHMLRRHASRIFTKAKEIGMMEPGYVWIVTDAIANELDLIEPSTLESMQGVVGIKTHVPTTKRLEFFQLNWRKRFQRYYPTLKEIPELNVFGLWAYDAAWALAMAVEKAGTNNLRYSPTNNVTTSSNYLYNLGVNQNGLKLQDAFSNVTFRGLAGEFSLINGQLQSSVFEIVNVTGNGERNVGFWSPENGLTTKLKNSTSASGLRSIIWPGNPSSAPKGWEIPTNGKRLRVGVPVKNGFHEFVWVDGMNVTGYCIEIFKAVLKELPYVGDPEFIHFDTTAGSGGTYDELVHQLFLGTYDAVVGDITIRANRSLIIDYTLPFIESGVSMVVPVKSSKKDNAWVFLKPLTWSLWVLTAVFFLLIALVVWILEHRVNEDFRGHPLDQICTSLWYSFSTMVFAHREIVFNNWTRLVVIIWLFVVLIITQSYTASLASLLTVQELKPSVTDINQLLKNGENIGYQGGSFIREILKSLKFDDSKLIIYESAEEMDELFTRGSANGGISAAMDETPYIKLFLAKYCSQYTTTEPTYKADGFAFGFPIGSPLVPDISRAILGVMENKTMIDIEKLLFQNVTGCSTTSEASTPLSVDSFWGLFLITGVVSLFSVAVYMGKFLYDEQPLWQNVDFSIWKRFRDLVGKFISRDVRAHSLRGRIFINGVPVHPQAVVVRDDHPRAD